jgi:LAO/AO transport system kinase
MAKPDIAILTTQLLKGDRRAAAKLITIVENDPMDAKKVISRIYKNTGKARIVGITGPPGSGKSTLVNQLAFFLRQKGRTVGIIAVDVSSPFSGGAFLGDRIRMKDLTTDKGIFIRSMATRGCKGGIARATCDTIKILDALGYDIILVETVGAGEEDVDIMNASHTSIVITVPGLGDDIQANKAGMMEIADIFVVNKADREGADMVACVLESMLCLTYKHGWKPPIVKTIATGSVGINELSDRIDEHFNYLKQNDLIRERHKRRAEMEIVNIARDLITRDVEEIKKSEAYNKLIDEIIEKKTDPHSAVDEIMMLVKNRYDKK